MHFFRKFNPLVHIPLIIGGVFLVLALAFVFGLFVMLLWNWLMPEIFGLTKISYWQAWGLVLLAHILFKGAAGLKHHHDGEEHEKWKKRFVSGIKKYVGEKPEDKADEGKEEQNGISKK